MKTLSSPAPGAAKPIRGNLILSHRHAPALGLLTLLALALWGRVLLTGQVLLPGAMLAGFYPFGGNAQAPWTILQWDALAQYYPWRHFAGQELRAGHIPLWNPFEFTGTPFVANAQSAVFYPLNLPFWVLDTAYAFGVAAFGHSLLAMFGTYFLCQRWQLSRAASVVAATAYAGCGYLAAWALLPTLFATASWLPLCLLLYEIASDDARPKWASWALTGSLACALLAGHAQIFFYIVLALGLRQPFLARRGRGFVVLIGSLGGAALLSMLQILPTLELAKYGHRAGAVADAGSWGFVRDRALQWAELPALLVPRWPLAWGSLNENFGYVGFGVAVLAVLGVFWRQRAAEPVAVRDEPVQNGEGAVLGRDVSENNRGLLANKRKVSLNNRDIAENNGVRGKWYALALAIFGLLYGLATPVAQFFFFGVPGVAQMGGTGRALLLWSLGAALLAGFGLDFLRSKIKSGIVPLLALGIIAAELGFNVFLVQPTAPRAQIYPDTALTTWLQSRVSEGNRVLFYTPRSQWLPTEGFRAGQTHPIGVLPPNGATVYRLSEVNGYDSLSLRQYRSWIETEETTRVGGQTIESASPQLNGNMVLLNNLRSSILPSLRVRYIVVPQALDLGRNAPDGQIVYSADGCNVWQIETPSQLFVNGAAFVPGWKQGGYNPETFRFGAFVSLCALGMAAAGVAFNRGQRAGFRFQGREC